MARSARRPWGSATGQHLAPVVSSLVPPASMSSRGEQARLVRRPVSSPASSSPKRSQPADVGDAQHQHWIAGFGERCASSGDVAEAQLGAHLQPVHGLRFGARVEQCAHAAAAAAASGVPSGTMPRYTASADTCRSRLADTASVARRAASSVQWIKTRCGLGACAAGPALRRRHAAAAIRCRCRLRACAAMTATPAKGADAHGHALGGVRVPRASARCASHARLHARRQLSSRGWRPAARPPASVGAQARKLDSGVGSTCRRRAPIDHVCPGAAAMRAARAGCA